MNRTQSSISVRDEIKPHWMTSYEGDRYRLGQKRKRTFDDDDTSSNSSSCSNSCGNNCTNSCANICNSSCNSTSRLQSRTSQSAQYSIQDARPSRRQNQTQWFECQSLTTSKRLFHEEHLTHSKLNHSNINVNNVNVNISNIDVSSKHKKCCIDNIPKELFLKVISFLGPASPTLITLTQVNKRYAAIMTQVGDAILLRAKASWRMLLPRLYINEPIMSLCTRHVQCFQDVMNTCNIIKNILEKDFVQGCLIDALTRGYICPTSFSELNTVVAERDSSVLSGNDITTTSEATDKSIDTGKGTSSVNNSRPLSPPVTMADIDQALDAALTLLSFDNITHFVEERQKIPPDAVHPSFVTNGRKSLLQFFSEKIEHQVLSLCGKCGGKAFKYVKMMSLLQNQGLVVPVDSSVPATVEAPLLPLASCVIQRWKDEERLDRARLVMQIVVHRFVSIERSSSVSTSSTPSSLSAVASTITTTNANINNNNSADNGTNNSTNTDTIVNTDPSMSVDIDTHSDDVRVQGNNNSKSSGHEKGENRQSFYNSWLEG